MGQINSSQGVENSCQDSAAGGSRNLESEKENEEQRAASSEQVRCVKTRIDMLIEDCLNTKDSVADTENEENRNAEILNTNKITFCVGKKIESEHTDESEDADKTKNNESKDNEKSDSGDSEERDKVEKDCEKRDVKSNKANVDKKVVKEELKLCDLITDMVQTELTQKQLKQIQQRTITTFNTFIDKVLDNSLNQVNTEEVKPKSSNILKLCSETMISGREGKNVDSTKENETNEKPECDRDNEKPKKVTLKDHIERFLELSFRDEDTNEEKKNFENVTNQPENFNAQGLVNSMITQGIQINRMLTKKEKQNGVSPTSIVPKEPYNTQTKFLDQNYKQQSHERYERSPNSNLLPERTESRNHHIADAKFRDHYFNASVNRNSHGYIGRDEMADRSREMQTRVNTSSKNDMVLLNHLKLSDHMSAFHQPKGLHGANSAYFSSAYGPKMQLSPGQMRELKSSGRGDGKQVIHVRDCMCAMCLHQPHSRHTMVDPVLMDHHAEKRSPNVQHQALSSSMAPQVHSGHVCDVPAMMRPSHSELPQGMVAYQGMHKLLPHHPPITSTKVYGTGQLLIPSEMATQGMVHNRQITTPESQPQLMHYQSYRNEEFQHNSVGNERQSIRSGKQSPYLARPSSVPSQEHTSSIHTRPGSGHRFYEPEYNRNSDSSSCASDCSYEAPLDLSVKKPKVDPARGRSSSNASAVRKIFPSNSFIKHLESSVDKYWQEMSSPPSSPGNKIMSAALSRSLSPDSRNSSHMYSQQSANETPTSGLLNMLQNRPLPSPHFTGGITVGQPLVDVKSQGTQKQTEYQPSNISQTGSQVIYSQMPQNSQGRQSNYDMNSKINKVTQEHTSYQGNQSNFDTNSKKSANNVSKHEPIQNIIGNHDPNDILYLICRLCTQTYGSPYGFRKHFRNQHGFEPRAEHTIVQTISATKTALHLPQPQLMQGMSEIRKSPVICKSASPETEKQNMNTCSGCKSSSVSPTDTRSLTGSEEGEKTESENTETKCLECPKCGKTFQLNDFGSYKRHCRQHGNVRMNGPFSCTDCHLPFPDQKSLREHCISHFKNTAGTVKLEQKSDENSQNSESHPTFYVCVKCDKQYDNIDTYKCHLSSHNSESKGTVELSISIKTEQRITSYRMDNEKSANIVSRPIVVKQAAESNTALACPDSSWDNVAKVVATSNKLELNPEQSDTTCSNTSNSSEKATNDSEESKISSPMLLTPQVSVESGSENEKKGEENEFNYKHKKFFHHRKRASSLQSQSSEASNSKQAKVDSDMPASDTGNLPVSSSVTPYSNPSCDSTGSESKVTESSVTNETVSAKSVEKPAEKPGKTEARHSLPFVWDRTTRSQKKS